MIWPCSSRVNCAGSDFPLLNASSEGPDLPQFTAVGFCCNGQQAWAFSLANQQDAHDALQRLMVQNCPDCVEERVYCADATCPDGSLLATYCLPTSQAEADALAEAHREAMLPFCDAKDELFSATCACPDGSQEVTMYSEISDEDALAACESVPRDCNPICNGEQICRVVCPDGTEFFYVVPACTIYAETVAEANALAYALACQRAAEMRICLGAIDSSACYGEAYSSTISATGASAPPALWEIISSNLPPGLSATLTADGWLVISGYPTANGIYTFSVKATTAQGSYAIRPYSICVLQIVTATLPNGTIGTAYLSQLVGGGGSGNYQWGVVSGTLPAGLSISTSGAITGTPTAAGTKTFRVAMVDSACASPCTKELTLQVEGCPSPTPVTFTVPSSPSKTFATPTWNYGSFAVIAGEQKISRVSTNTTLGCIEIVNFVGVPSIEARFLMNSETGWQVTGQIYDPDSGLIVAIVSKTATLDRVAFFDPTTGYVSSVELATTTPYTLRSWRGVLMRGQANKVALFRQSGQVNNPGYIYTIDTGAKAIVDYFVLPAAATRIYGRNDFAYGCTREEFYFSGVESGPADYRIFCISASDGSTVATYSRGYIYGLAYIDSNQKLAVLRGGNIIELTDPSDGTAVLETDLDDGSVFPLVDAEAIPVYNFALDSVMLQAAWDELPVPPYNESMGVLFLKSADLTIDKYCKAYSSYESDGPGSFDEDLGDAYFQFDVTALSKPFEQIRPTIT